MHKGQIIENFKKVIRPMKMQRDVQIACRCLISHLGEAQALVVMRDCHIDPSIMNVKFEKNPSWSF